MEELSLPSSPMVVSCHRASYTSRWPPQDFPRNVPFLIFIFHHLRVYTSFLSLLFAHQLLGCTPKVWKPYGCPALKLEKKPRDNDLSDRGILLIQNKGSWRDTPPSLGRQAMVATFATWGRKLPFIYRGNWPQIGSSVTRATTKAGLSQPLRLTTITRVDISLSKTSRWSRSGLKTRTITSLGRRQSHSREQGASPYKEQDNSHPEWPDHTDQTIYFSKIAEREKKWTQNKDQRSF